MRVVLLAEAQARLEAEDLWWRTNRDASDLFLDELEGTLRLIAVNPQAGPIYRRSGDATVRRWLMPRTRCHVYYVHDQARDLIEVHTIWGARRGRAPHL